jgi:hypothetical protein
METCCPSERHISRRRTLSLRRNDGAPRWLTKRDSTSMTRGERMRASTSIARPSLVNSSVTVRQLELLAVGTMIEHEVVGPDLVRSAWRLWLRPRHCDALPGPLAWQLQARDAPEPVGSPDTHPMAVSAEKDADAAVAVARILRRKLPHPLDRGHVLRCLATAVAQRRSRHRKQRAGPPHRETTLPAIRNLPPASRHAHQFFAATSFMTSISRSRSATSFFSRAFSISSCFNRRTSSA